MLFYKTNLIVSIYLACAILKMYSPDSEKPMHRSVSVMELQSSYRYKRGQKINTERGVDFKGGRLVSGQSSLLINPALMLKDYKSDDEDDKKE